jgi:hypothetical protein
MMAQFDPFPGKAAYTHQKSHSTPQVDALHGLYPSCQAVV